MIGEAVWTTIIGLSLLFVGGFVLWVYGSQTPKMQAGTVADGPEAESIKKFHTDLVQWFFLFGLGAAVLGGGCLVTSAIMLM